ncbi:MAG TPA: metal-dependent hydrolase [Bryobacteraceae bacterium]|nr:metal-dependent hydrolase [Bryobacteraceae bacterium]
MIEITWLGHGTFQFRTETGEVLLVDPWIEGNPAYPKSHSLERVDVLLITHGHFDHIHDAVPIAKRYNPKVVCIYEIGQWLQSKGVENVAEMNKGATQQAGAVAVTMTHAVHSCGILEEGRIIYGGDACGYVLRFADGRSVYFAGDTTVFTDMTLIRELYQPQLAFVPVGDLYTMGPREAAKACELLRCEKVIPMHYGTFPALTGTPEELERLLGSASGTQVWRLQHGVPAHW